MTDCTEQNMAACKLWVREEYLPAIERLIRLEERHEGSLKALELQAVVYEDRLELIKDALITHKLHVEEQFATLEKHSRLALVQLITWAIAVTAVAAVIYQISTA